MCIASGFGNIFSDDGFQPIKIEGNDWKSVKKPGCFEGCLLLVFGGLLAVVSVPAFVGIRQTPASQDLKNVLGNAYKECVYRTIKFDKNIPLGELESIDELINTSRWKMTDFDSRVQLNTAAVCSKTALFGKLVDASYGELGYGIDLSSGDKSCVTSSGDERSDWSCE